MKMCTYPVSNVPPLYYVKKYIIRCSEAVTFSIPEYKAGPAEGTDIVVIR